MKNYREWFSGLSFCQLMKMEAKRRKQKAIVRKLHNPYDDPLKKNVWRFIIAAMFLFAGIILYILIKLSH